MYTHTHTHTHTHTRARARAHKVILTYKTWNGHPYGDCIIYVRKNGR